MAKRWLAGLALAMLLAPPGAAAAEADKVTIHESVTSAPVRFETIKRLWVGSWFSAIAVPYYDTRAEAEEAFRQHAARLGGNGVINFGCYRVSGFFKDSRLACNGTVVKFQ